MSNTVHALRVAASVPLIAALASTAHLRAQTPSADSASVAFEVASIKQNKSGDPYLMINTNAGRFTTANFPLRSLIQTVFRIQPDQLVGGPDWLDDRYDISAKIPDGVPPAQRDAMVRTLLADRFKLTTHTETRQLPIYALVMNRNDGRLGPALGVTKNDCAPNAQPARGAGGAPPAAPAPAQRMRPTCGTFRAPGRMGAGGITMTRLAELLSGVVGRTVADRTGLTGYYEFELTYAVDPAPAGGGQGPPPPPGAPAPPPIDPNAPSIFTALQEQLGLKLDSTRGPVEVTVVDRIERPAED